MSTTVQVSDRYGGYIRSTRCILTGLINVQILDGRTNEIIRDIFVDPKDPEAIKWLRSVYQPIHLEILLG